MVSTLLSGALFHRPILLLPNPRQQMKVVTANSEMPKNVILLTSQWSFEREDYTTYYDSVPV